MNGPLDAFKFRQNPRLKLSSADETNYVHNTKLILHIDEGHKSRKSGNVCGSMCRCTQYLLHYELLQKGKFAGL